MRYFGIRYGYYDTRNFRCCRYVDPIVDTFCDSLAMMAGFMFAPEADQPIRAGDYMVFAQRFHGLMERNLSHHGGKFAAGDHITIADFVMASHIGNYIDNAKFPLTNEMQQLLDETPLF